MLTALILVSIVAQLSLGYIFFQKNEEFFYYRPSYQRWLAVIFWQLVIFALILVVVYERIDNRRLEFVWKREERKRKNDQERGV